jgi:uncharacterized protein with HEPN domain
MDRRLLEYLRQMKLSTQNSIDFLGDMSVAAFQADSKTQHAVSMSLINIGEAAIRIGERFPVFVEANPHIAWIEIRGMRNRIAHDYFFLNLQTIWDTVHKDLPKLLLDVSAITEQQP